MDKEFEQIIKTFKESSEKENVVEELNEIDFSSLEL